MAAAVLTLVHDVPELAIEHLLHQLLHDSAARGAQKNTASRIRHAPTATVYVKSQYCSTEPPVGLNSSSSAFGCVHETEMCTRTQIIINPAHKPFISRSIYTAVALGAANIHFPRKKASCSTIAIPPRRAGLTLASYARTLAPVVVSCCVLSRAHERFFARKTRTTRTNAKAHPISLPTKRSRRAPWAPRLGSFCGPLTSCREEPAALCAPCPLMVAVVGAVAELAEGRCRKGFKWHGHRSRARTREYSSPQFVHRCTTASWLINPLRGRSPGSAPDMNAECRALSLSLSLSLSQHVTKTKPNFEGGFVYDKHWVYLLFSPKRAPAARRGLIADCPPSVERHITEREYSSKLTPHQRPREVRASAGLVMFSVV